MMAPQVAGEAVVVAAMMTAITQAHNVAGAAAAGAEAGRAGDVSDPAAWTGYGACGLSRACGCRLMAVMSDFKLNCFKPS